MGTRADFFVQIKPGTMRVKDWRGSLAWDAYPLGIEHAEVGVPGFLAIQTTREFLEAINLVFAKRDDFTHPDMGYPWPWADALLTDFAYVFNEPEHRVDVYRFGRLIPPDHVRDEPFYEVEGEKATLFPDMTSKQKVTIGKRSGLIIVQVLRNE